LTQIQPTRPIKKSTVRSYSQIEIRDMQSKNHARLSKIFHQPKSIPKDSNHHNIIMQGSDYQQNKKIPKKSVTDFRNEFQGLEKRQVITNFFSNTN